MHKGQSHIRKDVLVAMTEEPGIRPQRSTRVLCYLARLRPSAGSRFTGAGARSPPRQRPRQLRSELRPVVRQREPASQTALLTQLPPAADAPDGHEARFRVRPANANLGRSGIDSGGEAARRVLTVAVDADDVVTGFADGFGGVGQDGDGVVVTVTW